MNNFYLIQFAQSIGKTTAQLTLGDMLNFNIHPGEGVNSHVHPSAKLSSWESDFFDFSPGPRKTKVR
jgi:hypothetical protein